jgi:hypothetical protein
MRIVADLKHGNQSDSAPFRGAFHKVTSHFCEGLVSPSQSAGRIDEPGCTLDRGEQQEGRW